MKAKHEIVYGRNPVLELIKSEKQIDKIWIDRKMTGDFEKEIRKLAKIATIPLIKVPIQKLNQIIKANHQGVLAFTTPVKYDTLADFLQRANEFDHPAVYLLLDRITDVRNIGAIARSAYWFGIDGIIYSIKSSAPMNADAIKSSAGALLHLPICRVNSSLHALEEIKSSGFNLIGTVMEGGKDPAEVQIDRNTVLILGSEEHGMSREITALVDESLSIAGSQKIDSLNVSVAAGILLYEMFKKRIRI